MICVYFVYFINLYFRKFAEDVTGEDVTEEQQAEQKDFRDILKKVIQGR